MKNWTYSMDIYARKRIWKIVLTILGLVIIGLSLFYTSLIVKKFATEERKNVKLWAEAVQRKANLVKYTEFLFGQLKSRKEKGLNYLQMYISSCWMMINRN